MNSNLLWKPVKPEKTTCLSDSLKSALRKRFDGRVNAFLNRSDTSYLKGLLDAGIKDAKILLDALDKYDEIKIWEKFKR